MFSLFMLKEDKYELCEKSLSKLWIMGWVPNPFESSVYFYEINKAKNLMMVPHKSDHFPAEDHI